MNLDHEKTMKLVGEHGEMLDVSNSQSADSLLVNTDRVWAEAAAEMKRTREFNTFYLYYLKIK